MDGPAADRRLELADWRRRIADLYAAVRTQAASDPVAAWQRWRETREALFREHPQSPLPAADRDAFRAHHWPYDPRLRFEVAPVPPAETAADVASGSYAELPISTGGLEALAPVGRVTLALPGGERSLEVYWMSGYAGGLFLPFRDATNGAETYGAGRYVLDTAKGADLGAAAAPGSIVVDLNFAFHPSCAFDPQWSCPLAPPANRLDLRIEAGERLA